MLMKPAAAATNIIALQAGSTAAAVDSDADCTATELLPGYAKEADDVDDDDDEEEEQEGYENEDKDDKA
ncbi:hypothetical protein AWZ03_013476 [Drosophila navojoa]|uniref:Uncharacterized protein n=1 Tax=Drosophila navojoa TaxID=7232 RepID=A0A484AVR5_DRONA|nr:hypothetical protein AWZ03_013476 [Drosophila navojoa]